ncbi:hypothetical protein [Amycolatopsis kentuckyensis]|nr:hypothetical protein [Amycolatopsis kentuckyensis]
MPDQDLPLPDHDQLPLGELRHRIRSLDEAGLRACPAPPAVHR